MTNWLTITQLAKYLQISKDLIYKMAQAKKIPAHKIGKMWRFDKNEIDN